MRRLILDRPYDIYLTRDKYFYRIYRKKGTVLAISGTVPSYAVSAFGLNPRRPGCIRELHRYWHLCHIRIPLERAGIGHKPGDFPFYAQPIFLLGQKQTQLRLFRDQYAQLKASFPEISLNCCRIMHSCEDFCRNFLRWRLLFRLWK